MTQGKLWTRPFVTLALVNFFSVLTFFLLTVKTTEYAIFEYGVAYDVAGSAMSFYILSALATRLVMGRKSDGWGLRRTLFAGCALNALASFLYLAPIGFVPFLGVRMLHGASMALVTTSSAAAIALIVPPERRAEGIGYFTLSQALATGVGPLIGIVLTNSSGGYDAMFWFTAVTGVASFLVFFLVRIPSVPSAGASSRCGAQEGAAEGALLGGRARRLVESTLQLSIVPLCASILLAYMCYSGILGFLTVYAADQGLDDAASLYFAVYSAVIVLSRPPTGRLVDKRGENSVMYVAFAALSLSFVALAFASTGALLLLSAGLLGFGNGVSQAVVQSIVARLTPPDQLGKANATLYVCMDTGSGTGPVIIGALILGNGYRPTFLVLAGVALVALAVYHFAHGRKPIARKGIVR